MDFKIITDCTVYLLNETRHYFMFKGLREMYAKYKAYVRVDLVMYAVMILMIIVYFIYSVVFK